MARQKLPTLLASLTGIAAGALGNYLAGDRLVFRPIRPASLASAARDDAAAPTTLTIGPPASLASRHVLAALDR